MNRTFTLLSAALGAAGVFFLTSAAGAQPPAPGAPPAAAAAPVTRPTSAVFNMAAVMREFGQAKYQVWVLNSKKTELSKDLYTWRTEYLTHQADIQKNPNHPDKEAKQQRMLALARMIEDKDRQINKQLNDDANLIIGDLYDKIKTVVDKVAEMNGYHIVFAYPDAVTDEEKKSSYLKELKLKPPAAQPFYIAPHADITNVVVMTLNKWYEPVDPKTGQKIDVSKLDVPNPAAPQGAPPAGSQGPAGTISGPGLAPGNGALPPGGRRP